MNKIMTGLLVFLFAFVSGSAGRLPGIEWEMLNDECESLNRQGQYDRATDVAKRALQVAEQAFDTNSVDLPMSLNRLAELYRAQGQYMQADPHFSRALAIWEKALGPDHPDVGESLGNLAALYRATKREKEAVPLEERAAAIRAMKR